MRPHVALLAGLVVGATLTATPAQAATTPQVSVTASARIVAPGGTVTLSGKVRRASSGTKVVVQRKAGQRWKKVTADRTNGRRAFAVTVRPAAGSHIYRVVVARTARVKWASSRSIRLTGQQTVVEQIRQSTNAFRAGQGLGPLKANAAMNAVAAAYAQKMHDTCTFEHNPNFSRQIPGGWTRAGENIAAGYAPGAVVQAWIDSPGHRANLLGNYTHIGIGYVTGTNCYRSYYVQVFAKY